MNLRNIDLTEAVLESNILLILFLYIYKYTYMYHTLYTRTYIYIYIHTHSNRHYYDNDDNDKDADNDCYFQVTITAYCGGVDRSQSEQRTPVEPQHQADQCPLRGSAQT